MAQQLYYPEQVPHANLEGLIAEHNVGLQLEECVRTQEARWGEVLDSQYAMMDCGSSNRDGNNCSKLNLHDMSADALDEQRRLLLVLRMLEQVCIDDGDLRPCI